MPTTKLSFEDRIESEIQKNPGSTSYDIAVALRSSDNRVKAYLRTRRALPLIQRGLIATHNYPLMEQPLWYRELSQKDQKKVPFKRTSTHSATQVSIPDEITDEKVIEKIILKAALVEKITRRGGGARRQAARRDAGNKLNRIFVSEALADQEMAVLHINQARLRAKSSNHNIHATA